MEQSLQTKLRSPRHYQDGWINMRRELIINVWWRRFGSVSEVSINLAQYDETFNVEVNPWEWTPPSQQWSFEGGGTTWRVTRYRRLIDAARDVAAQAAIAGVDKLTLLPSVRHTQPSDWEEAMSYSELVMKQLELIRATGDTNMFSRTQITASARKLELSDLNNVLDDPDTMMGDMLEHFSKWRWTVRQCNTCGKEHAPRDRCLVGGTQ